MNVQQVINQSPSLFNALENTTLTMNQIDFDSLATKLDELKISKGVGDVYRAIMDLTQQPINLRADIELLEAAKADPVWASVLAALKVVLKNVEINKRAVAKREKMMAGKFQLNKNYPLQTFSSEPLSFISGGDFKAANLLPQRQFHASPYNNSNVQKVSQFAESPQRNRKVSVTSNGSVEQDPFVQQTKPVKKQQPPVQTAPSYFSPDNNETDVDFDV